MSKRVTVEFDTSEDAQAFVRTINWVGIKLEDGRVIWSRQFRIIEGMDNDG